MILTQLSLLQKACLALSRLGDIYSDAHECRAAVLGAENLAVLAGMLSRPGVDLFDCSVYEDGYLAFDAKISISGRVDVPAGTFGPRGYTDDDSDDKVPVWTLCLSGHPDVFRLAMFIDDESREAVWVLDEAEAFYRILLKDVV